MPDLPKTVVLASIPRCGSTLLARAIAGIKPGSTWPKGEQFVNGVHKTHRLPSEAPASDVCIFVFGDPYQAVRSTIERRFDAHHARNCGCSRPLERVDLLARDDFGYEAMWDAWTAYKGRPTLFIRYPYFWRWHHAIETFVRRVVTLPEKVERSTEPGGVIPTYERLARKIAEAADCFTNQVPHGGHHGP